MPSAEATKVRDRIVAALGEAEAPFVDSVLGSYELEDLDEEVCRKLQGGANSYEFWAAYTHSPKGCDLRKGAVLMLALLLEKKMPCVRGVHKVH